MGFPEACALHPSKTHAYAQLGNAVVPPVVTWIGRQLEGAMR